MSVGRGVCSMHDCHPRESGDPVTVAAPAFCREGEAPLSVIALHRRHPGYWVPALRFAAAGMTLSRPQAEEARIRMR